MKESIIVDTRDKKSTISRDIYGHFSEHLGRCIYGGFWVGKDSPIPNIHGYNKAVVQAFKDIDIPNLRWPGGCFADEYHWKDGIGAKENRKRMINTNWGGVVEDNSFGTQEFFGLCEELGCKPYVCGNVGSGSVQEMDEWIEYMTFSGESPMANLRAANGRKEPYQASHSKSESLNNVMNSVEECLHDTTSGSYKLGLLDDMSGGVGGYQRGYLTLTFDLKSDSPYQIKSPDGGTGGLSTDRVGTMSSTVNTVEGESRQDVIDRIMQISGADIFSSGTGVNSDSGVVGSNSASVSSRVNETYKNIEEPVYGPVRDEKGRPVYVFEDEKVDIQTEDMNSDDVIIPLEYQCLNNYVLGISDMDTKTVASSREAIDLVDKAAKIVSEQRSLFGAYQNRLEHAALINDNTAENTTAAESLIRDTDMASEMVKYSKSNILSQAGQSMLAQANQSNRGILSFLE